MHLFLSYMKSHIYEIHALLAASIAFLLMFPLKKPVKDWISLYGERRVMKSLKWKQHRELYECRMRILLIVITYVLSAVLFAIISMISPMVHMSMKTAVLSGVFATTEYAVYEQLSYGRRKMSDE